MNKIVTFEEKAFYTVEMAAEVLHRHPQTIRKLCKEKKIRCSNDRGGFLISGWALRAYAENRQICTEIL